MELWKGLFRILGLCKGGNINVTVLVLFSIVIMMVKNVVKIARHRSADVQMSIAKNVPMFTQERSKNRYII